MELFRMHNLLDIVVSTSSNLAMGKNQTVN